MEQPIQKVYDLDHATRGGKKPTGFFLLSFASGFGHFQEFVTKLFFLLYQPKSALNLNIPFL